MILASLLTITICTITLLLLAVTTLVQQKSDIAAFESDINKYVERFNGDGGSEVRNYLSIQDKFETLARLDQEKIDVNRIWSGTNSLFGSSKSFLPDEYVNSIETLRF